MEENTFEELNILKINVQIMIDEISEAHSLSSNLAKICRAKSKPVDKKEILSIAKSIETKLNKVLNFYYSMLENETQSSSIEDALKTLKYAIENKKVKLCRY